MDEKGEFTFGFAFGSTCCTTRWFLEGRWLHVTGIMEIRYRSEPMVK